MSTAFAAICVSIGLTEPVEEYRFCHRKWAFDFCWPECKIALEVEGSIWTQGRHTRGSGFLKDMEKYNEAAILGWRVLRCSRQQFDSGDILATLKRAMP